MLKATALTVALALGFGAEAAIAQAPGGPGAKAEKPEVGVIKLSREDARRIRDELIARGYPFKRGDDALASELAEAALRFQKDAGLEPSGEIDVPTLDALGFGSAVTFAEDVLGADAVRRGEARAATERPAGMRGRAMAAGRGRETLGLLVLGKDHIAEIQERLKDEGHFRGDADGALSRELVEAVRQFQLARRINPATGSIDLATLAWLPECRVEVVLTGKPAGELPQPAGAAGGPASGSSAPAGERPLGGASAGERR